jgi:hypothetical protein
MKILEKIEDDLSDAWNDEIKDIQSLSADVDIPFCDFVFGFIIHWFQRIFRIRPSHVTV